MVIVIVEIVAKKSEGGSTFVKEVVRSNQRGVGVVVSV